MDTTPMDRSKQTWPPGNMTAALTVGTICGSALLAALALIVSIITATQGSHGEAVGGGLLIAGLFFLFSLPVWAGGLIVIGIPGWVALHALGWRSRRAGAAFGGMATFAAAMVLGLWLNAQNPGKPWELPLFAGALALIGAVVGWVVVATGYGEKEGAR